MRLVARDPFDGMQRFDLDTLTRDYRLMYGEVYIPLTIYHDLSSHLIVDLFRNIYTLQSPTSTRESKLLGKVT
jgi:hypothetical protein